MRRWTLASAVLVTATLAACGSPEGGPHRSPANDATRAAAVWLPTFTATPTSTRPAVSCRRAVDVELGVAGDDLTGVVLADRALGPCDAAVDANKRFYALKPIGDDCGSRVFYGQLSGPRGPSRVKVMDHSHRTCEDRRKGVIEIEEVTTGKGLETFAGDWSR